MNSTLEQEKKEYLEDLHTLAKAQKYITKLFGEEEGLDYVVNQCKEYVQYGKFAPHCYEYAKKELPQLTETQLAEVLPKTWDGKPIFSHKDLK